MRRSWMIFCVLAAGMLSGCSLDEAKEAGQMCPPTQAFCEKALGELDRLWKQQIDEYCEDAEACGILGNDESKCKNEEALLCKRYICDMSKLFGENDALDGWEKLTNIQTISKHNDEFCPSDNKYCMWQRTDQETIQLSCQSAVAVSCIELGRVLCHNRCIDPYTEAQYCGADDMCSEESYTNCKKNPTDKMCVAGECSNRCPDGQEKCNDICLNWTSNHISECSDGKITCDVNYADCDDDVSNGCETSLLQDSANCGACGYTCKKGEVCVEQECIVNSCSGNLTLCTTESGDACIDTKGSDINNCGACGYQCAEMQPNATLKACRLGQCEYECKSSYINIGNATNTKCIDLSSNTRNCGAIGNSCWTEIEHAADVSCDDGVCSMIACEDGYHEYENECESDSLEHCGTHGKKCSTSRVSNSLTVSCDTGKCRATSCEDGYQLSGGYCWQ